VAKDSKQFGKEMARYIDSKDQKRGDKKDKNKEKEKPKESVMDKVRKAAGAQTAQIRGTAAGSGRSDADAPAMWPLIKQVNVRCPAKALSTGAILVDLPGVADANAARNNIAKDYMKKANCIWILAPITRAVDDKTAKGMWEECALDLQLMFDCVPDLLGDAFKMQLMSE
jgi:Dynamin family